MRSRVVAVGSSTHRNRIGRVYSLWLTARAAGLHFQYLTVDDGQLWEPLRGHGEFLATMRTANDLGDLERQVTETLDDDTTIVVCKPRPELLHLARSFASVPVVVDIDDPELLDPWNGAPLVQRAKRIARLGPRPFRFGHARRVVRDMNVITSNPMLQELYGGELVPHVRELHDAPARRPSPTEPFVVGFVGTVREHKGVDDLRAAVAELARSRNVRLRVTAPPPADAFPWEDWVGHTTIDRGRELLEQCSVAAILSRPGVWGDRQLPVKLVDAMATGVPAVITARAPLLWAAGGSAVAVRDGSIGDLTAALALLADDPALAGALGAASWRRARTQFTPTAVAPALLDAVVLADLAHRRA